MLHISLSEWLQKEHVKFARYGLLPDNEGVIKDAIVLHFGKCRNQ